MTLYQTIYADPPWAYENKRTGGSMKSGASAKYDTLDVSELCAMPIRNIANKDSVLFLWATIPLLQEGLDVLAAWGYKYKTTIVWHKIGRLGLGYWFRGQVEVCLLGIRGNVKAFRCQRPNVIEAKPGRHSEKPVEMYEIIEAVAPTPRIELFARNRRSGWDAWGNEVGCDIEL